MDDAQTGKKKKSDSNFIDFLSISFSSSFVIEMYYKVEFVILAVKSYFIFYQHARISVTVYELSALNSHDFDSFK